MTNFVIKTVVDPTICLFLLLFGRSTQIRDVATKESITQPAQQCHMINGEGMTQQLSVTLNVNPNQIKVDGGFSGLLFASGK